MQRQTSSLCLSFFLLALGARAQEARLTGSVTDTSGAALTGVEITATQTARNLSCKATTAADGRYVFLRLPIGTHPVKMAAPNFRTLLQPNIVLNTNAEVC